MSKGYVRDLHSRVIAGTDAAGGMPDPALVSEVSDYLEGQVETADNRAGGTAVARARRAELRDIAINAAIDHFHAVLPGRRPRDYAAKAYRFLRRYKEKYGLKQAPSLLAIIQVIDSRAIRPALSESVERNYSSDIRATAPMHYARLTAW